LSTTEIELAKHGEQICRLRKDFNGHVEENREEFKELYKKLDRIANRLPNWASFLFAALTCLLGLLGGQLFK